VNDRRHIYNEVIRVQLTLVDVLYCVALSVLAVLSNDLKPTFFLLFFKEMLYCVHNAHVYAQIINFRIN
jgi:hypothetical protein